MVSDLSIFVWKWSKIAEQKKRFFKKIGFWGILGPPYNGIGVTIRIGREMLGLPYAGFFSSITQISKEFRVKQLILSSNVHFVGLVCSCSSPMFVIALLPIQLIRRLPAGGTFCCS